MSGACEGALLAQIGGLGSFSDLAGVLSCDARFNTLCFLFVFLPATILAYWAMPSRQAKLLWLTAMSFVFYSFWDYRFAALIVFSAGLDFFISQRIGAATDAKTRKRWLLLSLAVNLGLLGFFKYWVFAVGNFNGLMDTLGLGWNLPSPKLILPLGISFYTFQTLSYTIDVYRGHVEPTRNFLKYLAYVSMFPQLVAGPIVRYRTLADQLDQIPSRPDQHHLATGMTMFVIGLFKKAVLADTFSLWIDPYWGALDTMTFVEGWFFIFAGVLMFYFDFSGYSDMAIGLGAMLGLRFPINFRAPYAALNPADLWRRWHITLMTFARDYLYMPLGGNKVSLARMVANTYIIFIIVGLWHQASWTMVYFGAWHATFIVLYRAIRPWWDKKPRPVQKFLTYMVWCWGAPAFTVIDLRAVASITAGDVAGSLTLAAGWTQMTSMYEAMLGLHGLGTVRSVVWYRWFVVGAATLFTMTVRPAVEMQFRFTWWRATLLAVAFLACVVMVATDNSIFLYYQF